MRRGFGLPQSGGAAGPEAIARVARRAEELDSLWVYESVEGFLATLEVMHGLI
jgi:hypothetical protein